MPQPETASRLVDAVQAALSEVADPCMASSGYDLSIVDLGLVRHVRWVGGVLEVEITFTEPGCGFTHVVMDGVLRAAEAIPGVDEVRVVPTFAPLWSPDDLSPEARSALLQAKRVLLDLPNRRRPLGKAHLKDQTPGQVTS